jgi:hypothetical protein
MDYYFPILFLAPEFEDQQIECSQFKLSKRLWETSIFDLATLATQHELHLPYQAMDVFLSQCHLEIEVKGEQCLESAITMFQALRLSLYAAGSSPFLSPFITTYSINEYSGINIRDSKTLITQLHPGLREGLTSDSGKLEAWPFELSFTCITLKDDLKITSERFTDAANKAKDWKSLMADNKGLSAIQDIVISAPKLMPLAQSQLHIWSALEALFPTVTTELSFKVSLYLAQLVSVMKERADIYDTARASYVLRSAITHGARHDISEDDWQTIWSLLMQAINSILMRGSVPTEKELLSELLS